MHLASHECSTVVNHWYHLLPPTDSEAGRQYYCGLGLGLAMEFCTAMIQRCSELLEKGLIRLIWWAKRERTAVWWLKVQTFKASSLTEWHILEWREAHQLSLKPCACPVKKQL